MVMENISLGYLDVVAVWHHDGECVRRKDFLFVNIKDGLIYFTPLDGSKKYLVFPLSAIVRMEVERPDR